jgi:hypothetical protein
MVGGVLVERSVGDVLPVLTTNRENVQKKVSCTFSQFQATNLIENLEKLVQEKNQAMADFAKKHGLIGQQGKEEPQPEKKADKQSGPGVLV